MPEAANAASTTTKGTRNASAYGATVFAKAVCRDGRVSLAGAAGALAVLPGAEPLGPGVRRAALAAFAESDCGEVHVAWPDCGSVGARPVMGESVLDDCMMVCSPFGMLREKGSSIRYYRCRRFGTTLYARARKQTKASTQASLSRAWSFCAFVLPSGRGRMPFGCVGCNCVSPGRWAKQQKTSTVRRNFP